MFRPSLFISLLTAMFAVDVSTAQDSTHGQQNSANLENVQSSEHIGDSQILQADENEKIMMEARYRLGSELRGLYS